MNNQLLSEKELTLVVGGNGRGGPPGKGANSNTQAELAIIKLALVDLLLILVGGKNKGHT